MSEATLLVPSATASNAATGLIEAASSRLRALRLRLEDVAPVLERLDHGLRATAAELARARAQAAADRESISRLEERLAAREALRASLRSRLAELGRALGTA